MTETTADKGRGNTKATLARLRRELPEAIATAHTATILDASIRGIDARAVVG